MSAQALVIVIAALVVAAAMSISYYQYVYVPQVNARPTYMDNAVEVRIVEGASLESNPEFMDPEVVTVVVGVNSTVRWVNHDTVPHAIVSDTGYTDPVTGIVFDSLQKADAPFRMPGESFEFTFSEAGRYGYHHEPHPWIQGTVMVLDLKK